MLFLLMLIPLHGFSADGSLIRETRDLILKTVAFTDYNPIHQAESEMIQRKFQEILIARDIKNLAEGYTPEIDSLQRWAFELTYCFYEDGPDILRNKMRRAWCMAGTALLSDYDKAYTYLEFAKLSLLGNLEDPDVDLLVDAWIGINLIGIMMLMEEDALEIPDLTPLKTYLKTHQANISATIYTEALQLIQKIAEQTGSRG